MILFCSLIEPSLDIDMMPQWLRYYTDCSFDRYVIWLHDNGLNADARARAEELLKDHGWEYTTVTGEFRNGMLQAQLFQALRDTLHPEDRMVCADSDEVHDIEPGLYRTIALEHDYICGSLIDRWAPQALRDAHPDIPLDVQYPCSGDLYDEARKFVGGSGKFWDFHVITNKILCSKAAMPLTCDGSHGLFPITHEPDEYTRLSHLSNVNVWHYSWRGSALRRMMTKTYHQLWIIDSIVKFFGLAPDEPRILELRDIWHNIMLNDRGWIPSSWSQDHVHA